MLTHYNFGAARDPEMLHKIFNAEPDAPFIEILRFDYNQFDLLKCCNILNHDKICSKRFRIATKRGYYDEQ